MKPVSGLSSPLRPPPSQSRASARPWWRWHFCLAALLVTATHVPFLAQGPARRLTTIDAVHQYASYFHLQHVLLRAEFVESGTEFVLRADGHELRLLTSEQARSGPVEVRGQVIDVGRLDPGDPRLGDYPRRRGIEEWPRPGTHLVLGLTSVDDAPVAAAPSVRALTLEPWKFEGQAVTLVGRFRARNLLGDLPAAPGRSRYDFVLGAAEGALWVTGIRPRGRGFELDVERRLDTQRWVEVTGVVTRCGGSLVCLEASGIALAAEPETVAAPPEADPSAPPPAPAEVIFSIPLEDETDVLMTATVRIQFSKGLREASLEGKVRAIYAGGASPETPLEITTTYDAAVPALEIAFARPLEPFRTVTVELLPGIVAFDDAPLTPWRATFTVGAR